MTDRSALVTGSTSGIGLAIARTFASAEYAVLLNGFGDADEIETLRQEMEETYGVPVRYNGADISNPEACDALIAQGDDELGGIDVLVNNAGIQHTARAEDFPLERWQSVIDVNLSGAYYCIRAAVPGMREREHGRIINIASAHGLVASPEKVAYVSAKHGLVGMTKVVALENSDLDITCNAICPGWVLTPLVRKQIEDKAEREGVSVEEAEHDLLAEKQPMTRFTQPEDIGDMALYLASAAARTVTGTTLSIDGGWTAR
jgi:3-hydroxybutyrate dehydrogenase